MVDMKREGHEVVITGVGPVASIGVGRAAFWQALCAGQSRVRRRTLAVDVGRTVDLPLASMPPDADVPGLSPHASFLAQQGCPGYRDLAYTLLAVELALRDACIAYDRDRNAIGVVQAFEAPGVERTVSRLFELLQAEPPAAGPGPLYDELAARFYNMQPFLYVHLMGKALGLHGFSTSVHNACASGAFALEVAAEHIRTGQADVVVVAGGEAFDTAVRLEWFRRLGVYAPEERMYPFDRTAAGFYVGEGAAALVLESAAHAGRRGASVYAAYLGGSFAHQGWKQTLPDARAARLRGVIREALDKTGVRPDALDLVVPHGAATGLSDGYEAICLQQALDGQARRAVATAFKPQVGHLLASCGIIEMAAALLAMKHNSVPATLHARNGTSLLPVPLATATMQREVATVLKLSTGFTGHDAATVFRRP
jgi:3-oxoacyl-[acyl-carrier-protein] synthase II